MYFIEPQDVIVKRIDNLDYALLIEMFLSGNKAWVDNFGKVPMGICSEYKMIGVEPEPQYRGDAVFEWVYAQRTKVNFDIDNEKTNTYYAYCADSYKRQMEEYFKFMGIKNKQK